MGFWTDWLDNDPSRGTHSDGYVPRKAKWYESSPAWVKVSDTDEHERTRKASSWWRLWDWE